MTQLLDVVDACQQRFSFSCIEAPFQTGLTLPGRHVAQDWYQHTHSQMDSQSAFANVPAGPIVAAAEPVLKKLPIQWMIVVVKSRISDSTAAEPWYNLFATASGPIVLASTTICVNSLRKRSGPSRRPFLEWDSRYCSLP